MRICLPDRLPKKILYERYPKVAENLTRLSATMMENKAELVAWVGIGLVSGDSSYVFLPHGASDDPKLSKELMKAIVRFAHEYGRSGESSEEQGLHQAALLADLSMDYRDHGLFASRQRARVRNAGKPDWGRTIKRETAFGTTGSNLVYLDFAGTKPKIETDNIVSLIQAQVIREIAGNHAWWLRDFLGSRELPEAVLVPWPRATWKQKLRVALRGLYQDREINLVQMLLSYLEAEENSGSGQVVCGISDFSMMWEGMLRSVLFDVDSSWNARLPGPHYFPDNGVGVAAGRMAMDVVLRRGDKILILDAKYYRADHIGFVPGAADIVKQIFYRKAVVAIPESKGMIVGNAFVFPAKQTGSGAFSHIDMLLPSGQRVDDFETVSCYYVSTEEVICAYAGRRRIIIDGWWGKA